MKKFREWISIRRAKTPGPFLLVGIVIANIILFFFSAGVISTLAPEGMENTDFWSCVFYTISMVLDAGCVQYIVSDISDVSVWLVVFCLAVVILGMIIFTGAVIGYISNLISNYVDRANSGFSKLYLSNHVIILNWNTRASEIINDFLYKQTKETIVVFAPVDKARIEKEIDERLSDTIHRERKAGNKFKNKLTIIVREGDTYSTKQLNDICISQARSVIILSAEIANTSCKFDYREKLERFENGNADTIKTLVQVAQFTSEEDSADKQQIIVEVGDDWTLSLVNKIIDYKTKKGKCNIVPLAVNRVLGQILSQFSIMPELNAVYGTLFSNDGSAFFCEKAEENWKGESEFISSSFKSDYMNVPLTVMKNDDGELVEYRMTDNNIRPGRNITAGNRNYSVSLNKNYKASVKNVVILGHNSKNSSIMAGFDSFRSEWQKPDEEEILNIIVIDDEKSLKKLNNYEDYRYVRRVIPAEIYDKDIICNSINEFVDSNVGDTSVLILSDDAVPADEMDAAALTYLVYIQDIVSQHHKDNPKFDVESIDIVVEILNPKNYDVVHNYSVDNIVISNRYISKMVGQLAEKKDLYNFFNDILSYDEDGGEFVSKELYAKPVKQFFNEIPAPCTAYELVRAVYDAGEDENKSIALGYVKPGGNMVLFGGDQRMIDVELGEKDKIILFSNH